MKKYVSIILLCVGLNLLLCSYTLGGSCYLTVQSNIGEQTIYVPISYINDSFCVDSYNCPVNITGSAITGYTLDDSGTRYYRITINPYGETWTYRLNSGSYTTQYFEVTELLDTNINFVSNDSLEEQKINYDLILIGLLGMGVVICFMKS